MDDYKKMYFLLFNKITDVIGELQKVQQQAEELYISQEEPMINLIDVSKKEDEKN